MTVLNIRKNTAAFLQGAATLVENAKIPAKGAIDAKLNEYRTRAAALIMPSDMAFVITPKRDV